MEQVHEEEVKEEEVAEEEDEEESSQKKKRKNNKIFKYLQRHLVDEYKRIIHQVILSGIKMQELKLEEEFVHQNNCT
jgi:hypothetical protein